MKTEDERMKFKENGVFDIDSWFDVAPPKEGKRQWKQGRSAMELARYMTSDYPNVPREIEEVLLNFTTADAEFYFRGEHKTAFARHGLGTGEGRNHDAFLWHGDVVVGIEGKADEPFGSDYIKDAVKSAGENKMRRINGMIEMLFGDTPEKHGDLRYQLVTAATATLIEAKMCSVKNAVLLVIVFKGETCEAKNLARNNLDVDTFLTDISAQKVNDYYYLPTPYGDAYGIRLYFKKIEFDI